MTLPVNPSPTSYRDTIIEIGKRFQGPGQFVDERISLLSKSMKSSYFWGSPHAIFLSSQTTMEHQFPSCFASPLVTLVAKQALKLGVDSQNPGDKVVIFAPEQISITTDHLSIDNLLFVVPPKFGSISCNKLTLTKFPGNDPDYFPLVKNWLVNMDTVIEEVIKEDVLPPLVSDTK